MNPEISSTLIRDQQADVNVSAAITSDRRMPPQDQRNSRDVGLKSAGSGKLKDSQREPKGPVSVAVPSGTRVRREPAKAA